ncbi:MAG: hypothetical protein JSW73_02985 [Candidatus Woesearchaeota archaeon]|nr:MAG: hypothetical protein JSW73_02985 [Candidatus Woesearchaeota archaeon]
MKIPFYPNAPDWLHCMQACAKMILKYHFPEKDFSFDELDNMMGVKKGKLVTIPQVIVALDKLGLKCKYVTKLGNGITYAEYLEMGMKKYFEKTLGESAVEVISPEVQIQFSKEAYNKGLVEEKRISFQDLKNYFDKGCLILAIVDFNKLNNTQKDFLGHGVLITDINEFIHFHDPGEPPTPNRKLDKDFFMTILNDSTKEKSILVVFGKKNER